MTGWDLGRSVVLLVVVAAGARAQGGDPLLSPDPRVREEGVRMLGRKARQELAPRLERALADPDANVRTAALGALGRLPEGPPLASLIGAISDESPVVRRVAVELVGRTHAAEAVAPLLLALEDDSAEVRAAAVEALAQTGDAQVRQALMRSLQDRAQEVRRAALRALARIGAGIPGVVLQELARGPAAQREEVIETLGWLGARRGDVSIAEALIARLGDETEADAVAQALVRMGKPAVPALLRALERGSMPAAIVDVLGRIGDPRAAAALAEEVEKGRVEPARLARALGSFHHPAVQPALLALLEEAPPLARAEALDALVAPSDPVVAEAVVRATSDQAQWVRAHAFAAIGRLGVREGLRSVREALHGEDAALAEAAADAIARLGDRGSANDVVDAIAAWGPRATPRVHCALTAALAACCDGACARSLLGRARGRNDWVALGILRALAHVLRTHRSAQVVGPLLDEAEGRHEGRAEAALAALDALAVAQAAPRLARLVGDPYRSIERRQLATQALGGLLQAGAARVAGVEDALREALTGNDAELRAEAAWSLRDSNSGRAEAALARALGDPAGAVRANALGALATGGKTISADRLLELLRDPEPAVRANAAQLLDPTASRARLERLAEDDPDPMVRTSARRRAAMGRRAASGPNATGRTAAFAAILLAPDGVPLSDTPYRLQRPDGTVRCGRTDGSGALHEERLPPGSVDVQLPR